MVGQKAEFLLVRHGQSEWNARRRWQGRFDSPLTPLGRRQAANCAEALVATGHRFGAVRSSSSSRAAETGAVIAERLGLGAVVTDGRLCEADAGEWQGLTPDEIERAYPGFLADHRRPVSFEPFDAVVERAVDALCDAASAATDGSATIVATHSGLIRSLIRHTGALDERIPNLGGVWMFLPVDRKHESATGVDLVLGDRFDPDGVVVSGVDTPGEDPGEQADHSGADGGDER